MTQLRPPARERRAPARTPSGYSPRDVIALAAYEMAVIASLRGEISLQCVVRQPGWSPAGWTMPVEDALRGAIACAVDGRVHRAARYLRAARRVLGPYARNEWRACRALYRGTTRLDRLRGEV